MIGCILFSYSDFSLYVYDQLKIFTNHFEVRFFAFVVANIILSKKLKYYNLHY
jgi:hypothetical protein